MPSPSSLCSATSPKGRGKGRATTWKFQAAFIARFLRIFAHIGGRSVTAPTVNMGAQITLISSPESRKMPHLGAVFTGSGGKMP